MNNYLKIILFGFLVWLVPFLVSFFMYPLKTAGSPLFESVMPVIITIITVVLAGIYLKNAEGDLLREGALIGVAWFLISVIIDLFLFLTPSPMQMSITSYFMDIGITYLIIPIITIGMVSLTRKK
jgi:hypothetical protein